MPDSSIGRKVVMALTGAVLFGFVIGHMMGNLLIYVGPGAMNAYAAKLEQTPALVWTVRSVLLVAFLAHMSAAWRLTRQNDQARPVPYFDKRAVHASWASHHMWATGVVVGLFVVYHLAHFTFLWPVGAENFHGLRDAQGRRDVYLMVVRGFEVWWVAGLYVVAQVALFFHLSHGGSSMFRSLGLNFRSWTGVVERIGPWAACAILIGNVSIPAAVLLGLLGPSGQ